MLRRDAGANQAVVRGQPVEQLDLDIGRAQQLLGRMAGGWARVDDGDRTCPVPWARGRGVQRLDAGATKSRRH